LFSKTDLKITKSIPDLKTEGRTVFLDIEGKCDFKFGIEQQIVIT
jgi:hypothetical protein